MPQGISMTKQQKVGQANISLFLRLHNGNGCMLSTSKLTTLIQFKKTVSEAQLELPPDFTLVFQGKILCKEDATLSSLGLTNGSIIHIDSCSKEGHPKLKLDVGFIYQGEKMVIRAGREETISSLKAKIYRLIGVLPKNQLIIFRGCRLNDQQTLAFYHIAEDSLLCLHTNAQAEDELKPEAPFSAKRELISASQSVNFKRDLIHNKLHMFRSQSMGMQKQPYEIQIREQKDELLDSKDFKYELMTPTATAFISQLNENLSNRSSVSQTGYKIRITGEQFSRNQLMII